MSQMLQPYRNKPAFVDEPRNYLQNMMRAKTRTKKVSGGWEILTNSSFYSTSLCVTLQSHSASLTLRTLFDRRLLTSNCVISSHVFIWWIKTLHMSHRLISKLIFLNNLCYLRLDSRGVVSKTIKSSLFVSRTFLSISHTHICMYERLCVRDRERKRAFTTAICQLKKKTLSVCACICISSLV